MWDQLHGNWLDLAAESEKALLARRGDPLPPPDGPDAPPPGETERPRRLAVRLGQSFFRATVLASYGGRCCVCGLAVPALLVASHIIPWAARADLRVVLSVLVGRERSGRAG